MSELTWTRVTFWMEFWIYAESTHPLRITNHVEFSKAMLILVSSTKHRELLDKKLGGIQTDYSGLC